MQRHAWVRGVRREHLRPDGQAGAQPPSPPPTHPPHPRHSPVGAGPLAGAAGLLPAARHILAGALGPGVAGLAVGPGVLLGACGPAGGGGEPRRGEGEGVGHSLAAVQRGAAAQGGVVVVVVAAALWCDAQPPAVEHAQRGHGAAQRSTAQRGAHSRHRARRGPSCGRSSCRTAGAAAGAPAVRWRQPAERQQQRKVGAAAAFMAPQSRLSGDSRGPSCSPGHRQDHTRPTSPCPGCAGARGDGRREGRGQARRCGGRRRPRPTGSHHPASREATEKAPKTAAHQHCQK